MRLAKERHVPVETTNSIGMKLTFIPPGEFLMGELVAETPETTPQHRVRITKGLYLGTCEVTQREYELVMGDNPSYFKPRADAPVEQVSWHQAEEFCRRLSARSEERAAGRIYRLPTEAEWEHACRAGTAGRFHFGEEEGALEQYAWFADLGGHTTKPVEQKRPNAWGLYDMHGNVSEWCADWYEEGYYARSPVDDPAGSPSGTKRMMRGGPFAYEPRRVRAAVRFWHPPEARGYLDGFRVACTCPPLDKEQPEQAASPRPGPAPPPQPAKLPPSDGAPPRNRAEPRAK
jgi:formylglycine-generating enzyme required for sulfatase activity